MPIHLLGILYRKLNSNLKKKSLRHYVRTYRSAVKGIKMSNNNKALYKNAVIKCFLIYYVLQNNLFLDGYMTAVISKMEHFVTIVNTFQPLTIITNGSILDVAAVLDPPLQLYKNSYFMWSIFFWRVLFKRREVFFKISFLEVLKTMIICQKYKQKS